jgi:DUF971 family protein
MHVWPTTIHLNKTKDCLTIHYDDGVVRSLTATVLRVESPSAEVQGHHPSEKKIVLDKEGVRIIQIEPVGHYAIRLIFDDGHQTGLYTWDYLYHLNNAA